MNRIKIKRLFWGAFLGAILLSGVGDVHAQFQRVELEGAGLGEVGVQRWEIGFIFEAPAGPVRNIVATQSVPMDWPEQKVRIVGRDVSPGVDVTYREIDGAARRMVVKVGQLPAGAEVRAVITFETRRAYLLAPKDTKQFTLPPRSKAASLRKYLSPSPYIESRDRTIRDGVAKIVPKGAAAWDQVEAIYDWVRTNIEFVDDQGQEPVDTLTTLKQRHGDCDEMSCLFIALCRAAGIPARLVQVPGHVYAEFYLLDGESEGRWLPCQLAGTRAFGSMPEHRPVLQKGDNLSSPHAGRRERFLILPQRVTASSGKPTVRIVVRNTSQ
jgi:transglutaminase-like putative cysteine protease